MKESRNIRLELEDGCVLEGRSFGAERPAAGEVVFNTGMTGYPEALTDPSYRGQILVLTYPLAGNYGVPPAERESGLLKYFESERAQIEGLVVSEHCGRPSHWNAAKSLGEWLVENDVPAIEGIDTRALTKKLRRKGTMLGRVGFGEELPFADPNARNLVAEVSVRRPVVYEAEGGGTGRGPHGRRGRGGPLTVLAVDCGMKNNIVRCFLRRGVTVVRVPWDFDFNDCEYDYDGLFLSNGPGDPKMCGTTIERLRVALERKVRIFGICLGNQLLALAAGADTYKLDYGHRSQNQPCVEAGTRRCRITSQNHGFAVKTDTLPEGWRPWFTNANDGTNEGIRHERLPFMSVQFHPEANAGPTDTEYLFDVFIEGLRNGRA
ncbi:MAG: carbamoyl-phosphate synthase (glutamine-hydrolyzing) small subunit [Candidatus Latescibacterota bacterium]|nr:MAG: carbamoyl-phosphate synthase (glutamine-hydrolyzing) small subunit [Candidatus Latescibacterota bacterium]